MKHTDPAPDPHRRVHLAIWSRRLWWPKALVAFVLLTAATWLSWYWPRYGRMPDVVVQGEVIEHDGAPIKDAYVIVMVRVSRAAIHGSSGGCAPGSAVLRTDKDGRFGYRLDWRDAFGEKRPSHWSVAIHVYHPDFTWPVRRESQVMRGDKPSVEVWFESYKYSKEENHAVIEMKRRTGTEWENYLDFLDSTRDKCMYTGVERGQLDFLRYMQKRAWELNCAPEGGPPQNHGFPVERLQSLFDWMLDDISENLLLSRPAERHSSQSERSEYVRRVILKDYPRGVDWPGFGRDINDDELERFCGFFKPPVDEMLKTRLFEKREVK